MHDIKAHGMQVTDALRAHFEKKFQRIERMASQSLSARLMLTPGERESTALVQFTYLNTPIIAKGQMTDMYASIDLAIERAEGQVREAKGKIKGHRAGGGATAPAELEESGAATQESASEDAPD